MGADIEMRWIEAWNDLYKLIEDLHAYEIVLPTGERVAVEECQGWLQNIVYQGNLVALRRYTRKDGRHRIIVQRWPQDEPEPAWIQKTPDGFVLQ
jgi:hypothetical protein